MKLNCWEFKKCGRQRGGAKVTELGVCPAAELAVNHAINSGTCGGRACWAIAGTLCGGVVQGTFATKIANCMACDFYELVRTQEGANFMTAGGILKLL